MKASLLLLSLILVTACSKTKFGESEESFFAKAVPEPVKVVPKPVEVDPDVIVTDTFYQTAEKKVDFVWMIDNSGSMGEEQDSLADNFETFIKDFVDTKVDFKMGIITTDPAASKCGVLVPNSEAKLNSAAAEANPSQFILDFMALSVVGLNGGGPESGLRTLNCFHTKNPAFLRPDAYTVLITISDEEDQSPNPVIDYVNAFKSWKADPNLLKMYSIDDVNCANIPAGASKCGKRYEEAATLTGGKFGSIGEVVNGVFQVSNFAPILTGISESIMDLVQNFKLKKPAKEGTIKVFVNGVETQKFTYNPANRYIIFNADGIPDVGAKVEVVYTLK